jgi:hypothetical protein
MDKLPSASRLSVAEVFTKNNKTYRYFPEDQDDPNNNGAVAIQKPKPVGRKFLSGACLLEYDVILAEMSTATMDDYERAIAALKSAIQSAAVKSLFAVVMLRPSSNDNVCHLFVKE